MMIRGFQAILMGHNQRINSEAQSGAFSAIALSPLNWFSTPKKLIFCKNKAIRHIEISLALPVVCERINQISRIVGGKAMPIAWNTFPQTPLHCVRTDSRFPFSSINTA